MQVDQLAAQSGLSVDTIRYYQKLGLLHSPQRNGRVAEYDESHIARLAEIRQLSAAGFTLAQIGRLSDTYSEPLLQALSASTGPGLAAGGVTDLAASGVSSAVTQTNLSLAELAEASGLDQDVCELAVFAGLIAPISSPAQSGPVTGEPSSADSYGASSGEGSEQRFSPSSVEMLKVGLQLLEAGIPLEDLMAIASFHASSIEKVAESAVNLFAEYLLPDDSGSPDGPDDPESPNSSESPVSQTTDLGELVHRLVPLVTNLVAQHFQRTLVDKATQRIQTKDSEAIVLQRFEVPPGLDPLHVFVTAKDTQRAYWAVPDDDLEIAAIGSAVTLAATQHEGRFVDVDAKLRDLNIIVKGESGPPITGPLLLGGFAFVELPDDSEDESGNTKPKPDWSAFGAGGLTLPEILVVRTNGKTYVTAERSAVDRARELVDEVRYGLGNTPADSATDIATDPVAASPIAANTDPANDPTYISLVARALVDIDNRLFTKVVTARMLEQSRSISPADLLDRLRQRYNSCAIFAFARGGQTFLGASPELLLRLEGTHVQTEALAGSRSRGDEPMRDAALSAELLTSAKERAEHRIVAQAIREALINAGVKLAEPTEPSVMTLPAIQHLHTPIAGGAQANTRTLDLVAALHPTPAVAGTPRAAALNWIARHETFDRGWYAGPVGWATPAGSGEFRVALRCALLSQTTMTLFAGGGIVAGTNPQAELGETAIKFEALLSAAKLDSPPSVPQQSQPQQPRSEQST